MNRFITDLNMQKVKTVLRINAARIILGTFLLIMFMFSWSSRVVDYDTYRPYEATVTGKMFIRQYPYMVYQLNNNQKIEFQVSAISYTSFEVGEKVVLQLSKRELDPASNGTESLSFVGMMFFGLALIVFLVYISFMIWDHYYIPKKLINRIDRR